MAFWLDRFRRKDEEDIWEELKYWLQNPVTEEEQALRNQQEQMYIDKVLDRAFPVKNQTTKSEPYLKYEELFPEKELKGTPPGKATPVLEGNATYEKRLTPYEEIDAKKEWSDELKAQKKVEVAKIQKAYEARNREINRKHILEQAKNYGGAALEIGSLAVPGMLGSKIATGAIKTTKPLIEQIVKKNIARGGVEGLASGAMSGLGQGMLEDENLFKTSTIGGLIGGAFGSALGRISGEVVANTSKIKELDDLLDKRKDWGIAFTKQSGKPAEAIEKLLEQQQGFVPKATNKDGIGDIDFVWGKHRDIDVLKQKSSGGGLKHILERRNQQGYNGENFVRELPELFKEGKTYSKEGHMGRYYVGGKNKEAAIRTDYDKKPRNWLTSAYYLEETPLQASAGCRTYDQTSADKQFFPLSDLQKSNNIITNSNSNLNPSQQSIQKPLSYNDWLEELKRRRKKLGWW